MVYGLFYCLLAFGTSDCLSAQKPSLVAPFRTPETCESARLSFAATDPPGAKFFCMKTDAAEL
jgi:hypothetical protein